MSSACHLIRACKRDRRTKQQLFRALCFLRYFAPSQLISVAKVETKTENELKLATLHTHCAIANVFFNLPFTFCFFLSFRDASFHLYMKHSRVRFSNWIRTDRFSLHTRTVTFLFRGAAAAAAAAASSSSLSSVAEAETVLRPGRALKL